MLRDEFEIQWHLQFWVCVLQSVRVNKIKYEFKQINKNKLKYVWILKIF